MKLIFEKSAAGHRCAILPACDVEENALSAELTREVAPKLPELNEQEISRHYTELNKRVHGVNCGFYPLGSCTMKYNPRIDEETAALPGFTQVHPLAPAHTVEGCKEALDTAKAYLCEITGMDDMTFQPAAGAHGEFTGVMLIKQYHDARGDSKRRKIIVPDSAHGTNPATAAMCGYDVVNIASAPNGCVDLEALKAVLGEDTAAMYCFERIEKKKAGYLIQVLFRIGVIIVFAALAEALNLDYGMYGIISIVALYAFRQNRLMQLLVGALTFYWEPVAPLAFLLIALYNGKRGKNIKYAFYVFYPTHLLLLYAIARIIGCRY